MRRPGLAPTGCHGQPDTGLGPLAGPDWKPRAAEKTSVSSQAMFSEEPVPQFFFNFLF